MLFELGRSLIPLLACCNEREYSLRAALGCSSPILEPNRRARVQVEAEATSIFTHMFGQVEAATILGLP